MRTVALLAAVTMLCACSDNEHSVANPKQPVIGSSSAASGVPAISGKFNDCPENFRNSFNCELFIEGEIAKQYPQLIKRNAHQLEIKLKSGEVETVADNVDEDYSTYVQFALVDYFPEIDFGVLYLQHYEGQSYDLIDMKTGELIEVGGKVSLSPNKRRIAVFLRDPDAPSVNNKLTIYFVSSTGLLKEYEIQPIGWGPGDLKWVNDRSITGEFTLQPHHG